MGITITGETAVSGLLIMPARIPLLIPSKKAIRVEGRIRMHIAILLQGSRIFITELPHFSNFRLHPIPKRKIELIRL